MIHPRIIHVSDPGPYRRERTNGHKADFISRAAPRQFTPCVPFRSGWEIPLKLVSQQAGILLYTTFCTARATF